MNLLTTLKTLGVAGALLAAPAALAQSTVTVTNDITSNTTWTAGNEYLLNGLIFVNTGATLTIEPGTVVRGRPVASITNGDQASALIVRRGARILADGTADEPIIFTIEGDDLSDAEDFSQRDRGQWAGIILLGRATTNQPTQENQIEGIPYDPAMPAGPGNEPALFGGTDDDDNSGILRYVSIRYSGFSITGEEGDEIQGITLGAVGRGTTIEYVEIYASADDGIEWFGGTVNVKYALVAFPFDDAFDYDQGWRGNGQFWFTIADTDAAGRGGEHDGGDDGGDNAVPYATPVISNATYIGSGATAPADGDGNDYAFRMRDGAGGYYFNSVFAQYPDRAIDLENFADAGRLDSYTQYEQGRLRVVNNVFFDFGRGSSFDDITDANYSDDPQPPGGDVFDNAFAAYMASNNTIQNPQFGSIFRAPGGNGTAGFDPRPRASLPAAQFGDGLLDDDFFTAVNFLGAFRPNVTPWYEGWTAFSQSFSGTAVANEPVAATGRAAFGVSPNPTAGLARVTVTLPAPEAVTVRVYDVLGRAVVTLADGAVTADATFALSTENLPAGLYIIRLETADRAEVRRLTVVK